MVTEKDRVTDDLQKYIKKSQWDKAIQALDRLAALEPNNAVHRLRAGDYYLKLGATPKAVTAYHQAASVFTEGGFVVKALAAYKMVLRLDPQNKNAHEKMQALHGQARRQTALSQPYVITADRPNPEGSAALSRPDSGAVEESREAVSEAASTDPGDETAVGKPSAAAGSIPEPAPEQEELDEGVIGVQPFNLDEFGSGTKPPAAEPVPMSEAGAESAAAAPPVDPLMGGFEIERTSYAEGGGASTEPATETAAPASEPGPPERRMTDVMPLFSSLAPEEFSEVVERMMHFQYPSGYRIVKEGDTGDSVYLISQGAVQVVTKIGNREVALSELKDNDFFGEVGFLTGRPRTASVITQTDTEILELRGEDLKAIAQKYPRVREVLEGFYKARVRDTLSKVKHPGP
ncbi:MAG: cyclic nucleotide-binding domain-containing protein [Nitrospirae bacterium]|nr:cyclic nucleotide-binding domain-containing protein [Nitrospirota bacterium]